MNVGVCLTATGAVFAIVRTGPDRLATVAEILAPDGSWRTDDWGTAVRLLTRTRRRLRLPRRGVVNVVALTGPGAPAEAALLVLGAGLLARAGFVPASAGVGRSAGLEVEPNLAEAVKAKEHRLAVGAAAALLPGRAAGAAVPSRRTAPTPAPAGRMASAAVGQAAPQPHPARSRVAVLEPGSDWTDSAPARSPARRADHSAVATGRDERGRVVPPSLASGGDGAAADWLDRAATARGRAVVPVFTVDTARDGSHLGLEPEEWTGVEASGTGWLVEPVSAMEPDAV